MARIRTIKPEFFTSEDIVSLSPLARLLYIALWCEADKEGRLVWKPLTFKLRYLPGDSCDIHALCKEILDRGLVCLYSDGLAYIPSFTAHQHINPRESASQLPDHKDQPRVGTRQPRVGTGANLDVHPQVGREGKGRERNGGGACASAGPHEAEKSASPPPPPIFSPENREFIKTERPDLDAAVVWLNFCDHYPGDKCTPANWRKWVRREMRGPVPGGDPPPAAATADPDSKASVEAVGLARGMGRWDQLFEPWQAYKTRVKNASSETLQ